MLGRLGRSVSGSESLELPVKTVNPFLRYSGKKINSIQIVRVGFDSNINDTVTGKNRFFINLANDLHTNSRETLIKRNLFFKEGDNLIPLLLSDNERFLREQEFLQDAMIIVQNNDDPEMVDIIVITRDVFSLGGKLNVRSAEKVETQIKEENFQGMGGRVSFGTLYDKVRSPHIGFNAEYLQRNIFRRFMNASVGFTNFDPALVNGLASETSFYFNLEKPLVHRYKQWTGAFNVAFNKTANNYLSDSVYKTYFNYRNIQADIWAGYNVGKIKRSFLNILKSYTSFLAMRSFYVDFKKVPDTFANTFNYNYANINGVLISYNLFRQNFYKTSFIYGFGRNEDLPVGINTSVTAGWTNKDGKRRGYYGLSVEGNYITRTGKYFNYGLRAGGFSYKKNFEDIDLMVTADHFTNLKKLRKYWRNRQFFGFSFARQFRHLLNNPLFLRSEFGLPYFTNPVTEGRVRTTIKGETVFYHLKKFLGFRFAPFLFTDISLLTPRNEPFKKTSAYYALGSGFRTRNENLIFGTMELRGYYFPRTVDLMKGWRIDFTTNIRFKYNSTFIKKPDFVVLN